MKQETTAAAVRTNCNDNYKQFTGTDHWYKHSLGYIFTDGVAQVAEDCGAYWYIDVVISWQLHTRVRAEGFQTWKLERVKDDKFKVTATDGNHNVIATQKIPYSDFKYDEVTFWLVDNVIMLPTEY